MIVVADSNVLIGLAKGDVFDILQSLFGEIWLPGCVWNELVGQGAGRSGAAELAQARSKGWVHLQEPQQATTTCDATVLALALELSAQRLLTDDAEVAAQALVASVRMLNTAEVVFLAHLQGLVPRCREVFDRMQTRNFGIRASVRQHILQLAGEA